VVDYTYEPYGRTTADATNGNTQQYTGRENDNPGNAGGLYYYRARYYMPGCARFISEDPIGWASGQTNNYSYVGGDPIGFVDPFGLMKLPCGPSGLPPEWQHDPSHRYPNGERYRHPGGDTLDWHPGTPGATGWEGKDHWHHNGGKWHYPPGAEVPDPKPTNYMPYVVVGGVVVVGVVAVVMAPQIAIPLGVGLGLAGAASAGGPGGCK
jgi:RHS repeat-associated protein